MRSRRCFRAGQEEVDKQLEEVVFDHLHATAFQGQALGRTILGPKENILSIQKSDLQNYINTNYKADRMVLVGSGGIPHEELVGLAEMHFSNLKSSDSPLTIGSSRGPKPEFIGSEVRTRDDTIPTAHIAIAVEGVSWKDPDYFTALVAQAIIGNYDRAMGNAPHLGSKLSTFLHKHHLANSFMSFSTSYSDVGLWGAYMVTDNITNIDDLVHFTLREWNRMAQTVTESEVERAKAQLKASLLLSLDGTTAIAEDIGRQIVTTGRRMSPAEIERVVGAISEKDVIEFAQRRIWDQDVAISAVGSIEGVCHPCRGVTDQANECTAPRLQPYPQRHQQKLLSGQLMVMVLLVVEMGRIERTHTVGFPKEFRPSCFSMLKILNDVHYQIPHMPDPPLQLHAMRVVRLSGFTAGIKKCDSKQIFSKTSV